MDLEAEATALVGQQNSMTRTAHQRRSCLRGPRRATGARNRNSNPHHGTFPLTMGLNESLERQRPAQLSGDRLPP